MSLSKINTHLYRNQKGVSGGYCLVWLRAYIEEPLQKYLQEEQPATVTAGPVMTQREKHNDKTIRLSANWKRMEALRNYSAWSLLCSEKQDSVYPFCCNIVYKSLGNVADLGRRIKSQNIGGYINRWSVHTESLKIFSFFSLCVGDSKKYNLYSTWYIF